MTSDKPGHETVAGLQKGGKAEMLEFGVGESCSVRSNPGWANDLRFEELAGRDAVSRVRGSSDACDA